MTIEVKHFDEASKAISFLEKLALGERDYIFRGHCDEAWKLQTSLKRYTSVPHESWSTDIDDMLDKFRVGLTKLGLKPFESNSRLDWLEYARHHGVPTPVLDFSHSPYVALFFAFNGIRCDFSKSGEYAAVYAIDIGQLAWFWATLGHEPRLPQNRDEIFHRLDSFSNPEDVHFGEGFPADCLRYMPFPGEKTPRMQRQQGAFLYDTLKLENLDAVVLDDLISRYQEPTEWLPIGPRPTSSPIAYKICINKNCGSDIFPKLELMGINAGFLYMDARGVAEDVINSYNYTSKSSYLRDVCFSQANDAEM